MTKGIITGCEINYLGCPLEVIGTYFPSIPATNDNPESLSEFEISEVFISVDGHRVKGDDFLDTVSSKYKVNAWQETELKCIESIERGM